MEEIWKSVVGYEDLYEVSNLGRVRSLARHGQYENLRILVQDTRKDYPRVTLSKGNKHRSRLVHRLVAEAHISNALNYRCVNHIDGNKHNNTLSNLQWRTQPQNMRHAFQTGLAKGKSGSTNGSAKLTEEEVLWIKAWLRSGFSNCELGRIFNVSDVAVSLIKRGLKWQHVDLDNTLGVA